MHELAPAPNLSPAPPWSPDLISTTPLTHSAPATLASLLLLYTSPVCPAQDLGMFHPLLLECSSLDVHMALYLTASGVCSNVTLLDNSCPDTPQIPLPPPSLSLYSALLFVITLAIYCVFTCSWVFWFVSAQMKECFMKTGALFVFFSFLVPRIAHDT